MYILILSWFFYTNVMALFNKFYNTILEQEVLTCKNQKKILSWGQFCCALFFIILNFLLSVTNNIERNRIYCRLQLYLDIQKKKKQIKFFHAYFFLFDAGPDYYGTKPNWYLFIFLKVIDKKLLNLCRF